MPQINASTSAVVPIQVSISFPEFRQVQSVDNWEDPSGPLSTSLILRRCRRLDVGTPTERLEDITQAQMDLVNATNLATWKTNHPDTVQDRTQPVFDENGNPVLDGDGKAVTTTIQVTIPGDPPPPPLTRDISHFIADVFKEAQVNPSVANVLGAKIVAINSIVAARNL